MIEVGLILINRFAVIGVCYTVNNTVVHVKCHKMNFVVSWCNKSKTELKYTVYEDVFYLALLNCRGE